MSATNDSTDPLDIFAETTSANQEPSMNDSHSSANPFDPLGGSQSTPSSEKTAGAETLDLLGQISSWGEQNKGPEAKADDTQPQPEAPVSPTTHKDNVMATKAGALELSDDLVAEAHREFEATEDKLRKFEQAQLSAAPTP